MSFLDNLRTLLVGKEINSEYETVDESFKNPDTYIAREKHYLGKKPEEYIGFNDVAFVNRETGDGQFFRIFTDKNKDQQSYTEYTPDDVKKGKDKGSAKKLGKLGTVIYGAEDGTGRSLTADEAVKTLKKLHENGYEMYEGLPYTLRHELKPYEDSKMNVKSQTHEKGFLVPGKTVRYNVSRTSESSPSKDKSLGDFSGKFLRNLRWAQEAGTGTLNSNYKTDKETYLDKLARMYPERFGG